MRKGVDFMVFGYAMVRIQEQNLTRQLDALNAIRVEEKIIETKMDRLELNRLLDKLRKGDIIIISDLTRLSIPKNKISHNYYKN